MLNVLTNVFGHSFLDNIIPKGDRRCLKHIGPRGSQAPFCYQDAKAAFRWLEPLFVLVDAEGNLGHSEMTYGNSVVMVGNEWSDNHKSPKSIGGKNSQSIHVQLADWTPIVRAHALPGQKSLWNLRCSSTVTAPIVPEILRATFGLSASPSKK
jgi:hypothetical protein